MQLAVLFTAGKDSCFALYRAKQYANIACCITLNAQNKYSYMFHTVNIELTKLASKALGIKQIVQKTTGQKEKEISDLLKAIRKAIKQYNIDGVVSGAIASTYQATRIQQVCNKLNIHCFNPLWCQDQITLLKQMLAAGFEVIITGIFAWPLTQEWLGRKIDEKAIKELSKMQQQYKLNPSGEGGEIETLVLDCPLFKKRIEIVNAVEHYKNHVGWLEIKKAKLTAK